ncbi:ABC transporter, partial [Rhizobium leguminosarum]
MPTTSSTIQAIPGRSVSSLISGIDTNNQKQRRTAMNWKCLTITAAFAGMAAALHAQADQLDNIMSAKTLRC